MSARIYDDPIRVCKPVLLFPPLSFNHLVPLRPRRDSMSSNGPVYELLIEHVW